MGLSQDLLLHTKKTAFELKLRASIQASYNSVIYGISQPEHNENFHIMQHYTTDAA